MQHNYSRKRWTPDPSLPPEELAEGLAELAEADTFKGAIKEWYKNLRLVYGIRKSWLVRRILERIGLGDWAWNRMKQRYLQGLKRL